MTDLLSPYATPGDALQAQAEARPEHPALVFQQSGQTLTYGEWHKQSSALAQSLLTAGLGPGDPIGLLAENRIEWPVVQLAVAMIGAELVPLNTHYRQEELGYALENAGVRWLFLSETFRSSKYLEMAATLRPTLPELEALVALDPVDDLLTLADMISAGADGDTPLPDVDPWAVGSLQYTSGTTGFPKGALLTNHGMMANAWGISGRLRVTEKDRWLTFIPLFHCAGCIMTIMGVLQRGCTYYGVPGFDTVEMFRIIEDARCTMISGVPTSYIAMLESPERTNFDLTSLRAGTCGGADTDPELLKLCAEAFPVPGVVQVYGQTEASTLTSLADCEDAARWETCGPPLPGAEVRITDSVSGALLAAGEIGQIETTGPMLMRGYHKNPEATAETIREDGWMRTGDLGYLNDAGYLVMAGGRLRDMVIRGGENIYPVEIENLIRSHPAISDIAVFGIPDDYYGEAVAAAVSLIEPVTPDALASWCKDKIAGYKVPAHIFEVTAFPLTASGKIRKTELEVMAKDGGLKHLE
jgi:fatty-acyl-CoA synthase